MNPTTIIILIMICLMAGIFGGMFGVGGEVPSDSFDSGNLSEFIKGTGGPS